MDHNTKPHQNGVTTVTHAKATEQALKEVNLHLADTLDNISCAFYILDAEERFTYMNHKVEELWNMRREDLLGQQIWTIFPEMVGQAPYQHMRRALTEQIPVTFETYSEYIQQWVAVNVYPVGGGVSVHFHDITNRKKVEEALRRSEIFYRTLVQNIPNCSVLIFDQNLRFILVEGETLHRHGFPPGNVEGKTLWEVLPEVGAKRLEPFYRAALAGNKHSFETHYEGHTFLVQAIPVKDENAEIFAGMLLTIDVTDK
jgi:PAS domain S-box-containing protein